MIVITAPNLTPPFFLAGNSTALLFLHGFGASPSEVYPTAALIHNLKGYTISGPLLPGHGTSPEELNKTGWTDWYEAVEREINHLSQQYERVAVAGLSMGGLLALLAGCRHPGLAAVAAINAPIFNQFPILSSLAPLIQLVKPFVPKGMSAEKMQLEKEGRFAYHVNPVKACRSLLELRNVVAGELDHLKLPLLVVQSEQDESVKPRSARYIMNHVPGSRATLLMLPESTHIATMGPEKEKIAQAIIDLVEST